MPHPKRRLATTKRKGKIKLTKRARLVEKNDNTYVAKPQVLPIIQGRPPANVGVTFRVKIRRK